MNGINICRLFNKYHSSNHTTYMIYQTRRSKIEIYLRTATADLNQDLKS
jgi:hypothetical protein